MPPIPFRVNVKTHPGSSEDDIKNEPDWSSSNDHRIGFLNLQNRIPGLTHSGDEQSDDEDNEHSEEIEAIRRFQSLKEKKDHGELINFRDIVENEKVNQAILRGG